MRDRYIQTAESVTEGHPDKLCDTIADTVLDACLRSDPAARVACEVLDTAGKILVAGEITAAELPDIPALICRTVREAGYGGSNYEVEVITHDQSGDIAALVMGDDLHFVVGAAIARFPHRPADKGGNVRQLRGGDLAGHEDLARCVQDLTGHTGGWVAAEAGIQNCVRDGIAQLVRVSLGDRLCGLNVSISHVIFLSWDDFSPLVLSPEQ